MVSSSAHHLLLTGRDGWFRAIILLVLLLQKTYSSCPAVCDCSGYNTRKTIRCHNLDLTDVPLGLPADTKNLRLEYNSLTKLAAADFMNLSQLEKLHLYNNQINVIEDGAFRGLSSLVHLQLTSNSISEITNETFAGAPKLEKLDLRNNHLSDLPSGAFSQVPLLSYLDLAANNLNEFPADVTQDLANLKELHLSENPVTLAPSFGQQLGGLEDLRLKNIVINAMGQFPVPDSAFDGLVNLTILELHENNLTEIPQAVKSLPNLITIRLEDNLIRNVKDGDFHDPCPLQDLYLNGNSLVEVPTSGLSKLPELVNLELDYNLITTIPARSFWHNTKLEWLSLNEAGISSIDKDAFQGLQSLEDLSLYRNYLTTIVDGVFDNNPSLRVVLAGNPLLCDCNLRAFGGWLKNNTFSSEILKCAAPERLQGTKVVDLEPEQFACEPRLLANTIHTTSATQGTGVSLPCGVEADPIAEIYWITNNHSRVYPHQPKPRFYFLSGSNGTLMVTAVSLTDQGSYTCVVKNSAGEMSNSITLDVSMPVSTPPIQVPTLTPVSGETVMVFGISGGVIACVVVLVLIAAIVAYRNSRTTDIQNVPLPPIPLKDDECIGECNSVLYDEIPGAHNTDTNGYTTRISFGKQPSKFNPDEETNPVDQHVVHTYLDPTYKKNNNNQEGKVSLGCDSYSRRYTTTEQSNPSADQDIVQTYLDPKSKKNSNNREEEVSCRWVKGNNAVELSNEPRYSTTGPSNQNGYMTMKPLPHQESK